MSNWYNTDVFFLIAMSSLDIIPGLGKFSKLEYGCIGTTVSSVLESHKTTLCAWQIWLLKESSGVEFFFLLIWDHKDYEWHPTGQVKNLHWVARKHDPAQLPVERISHKQKHKLTNKKYISNSCWKKKTLTKQKKTKKPITLNTKNTFQMQTLEEFLKP